MVYFIFFCIINETNRNYFIDSPIFPWFVFHWCSWSLKRPRSDFSGTRIKKRDNILRLFLSDAQKGTKFSGNGVRKQDQHFAADNHYLFCLDSSSVEINEKTYGAQPDEREPLEKSSGDSGRA